MKTVTTISWVFPWVNVCVCVCVYVYVCVYIMTKYCVTVKASANVIYLTSTESTYESSVQSLSHA